MSEQSEQTEWTLMKVHTNLRKPEEYVRRVLEKMFECKRTHGTAFLRLGMLGHGHAPNYTIEYPALAGEIEKGFTGLDTKQCTFGSFYGLSHKTMKGVEAYDLDKFFSGEGGPEHPMHQDNWSSERASLEEVQHILGLIRSNKRKPRTAT